MSQPGDGMAGSACDRDTQLLRRPRRVTHERPIVRQVLECASPLALSIGSAPAQKRQRTGALQRLRPVRCAPPRASVLECGSPLPLSRRPIPRSNAPTGNESVFSRSKTLARPTATLRGSTLLDRRGDDVAVLGPTAVVVSHVVEAQ